MTTNDEIYNKIKLSLQSAKDAIKLKERIENEISNVLEMVVLMTEANVAYRISDNKGEANYKDCERIVHLSKSGILFGSTFILCGFTINKTTGYPVAVETDTDYYNCDDESTLKSTLADVIASEKNSMAIISLIATGSDIPF